MDNTTFGTPRVRSGGKPSNPIEAIDNDGVKRLLIASKWSKITGLSVDVIRNRFKNEMRQRSEGFEPRDMRQIVGLDPLVKRPNGALALKMRREQEHSIPEVSELMNRFTLGRA